MHECIHDTDMVTQDAAARVYLGSHAHVSEEALVCASVHT